MTLTVLYFAKARELAGTSEEVVQFAGESLTLRRLLQELTQRHPELAGAISCMRVARNEEFAELDDVAGENDVIALIPPVAGG